MFAAVVLRLYCEPSRTRPGRPAGGATGQRVSREPQSLCCVNIIQLNSVVK